MNKITKILTNKVKSISTRFYYKQKKLCFQILLIYGEDKLILSREFENYQDYRLSHESLVKGLNEQKELLVDFIFPKKEGGALSA